MKYIIKNCPCLIFPLKADPECSELPPFNNECKNRTDCLLKQIVSLTNTYYMPGILELLEIKEVENDIDIINKAEE